MADIRNIISVTDRASSQISKIQGRVDALNRSWRALDSTISSNGIANAIASADIQTQVLNDSFKTFGNTVDASVDTVQALEDQISAANEAAQALSMALLGVATGGAGLATSAGSGAVSGLGTGVQAARSIAGSGSDFLGSIAAAVYLLEKAAKVASDLFATVDLGRSVQARLELFGPDGTSGTEAYASLFQLANQTRSSLEQTSNIVSRVLVSNIFAGENALNNALTLAGLVNKSLVSSGATAQQASSAVEQLLQGLGAGQLYWQDLRIILQQAPGLAKGLVDGLNMLGEFDLPITTGDLKQLASDGELTAERIVKAFWAAADGIEKRFDQFPTLWSQNASRWENFWDMFLTKLGETDAPLDRFNQAVSAILDRLEEPDAVQAIDNLVLVFSLLADIAIVALNAIVEALIWLTSHTEILIATLIVVGVVLAGLAIKGIIAFVSIAWPIIIIIGLLSLLIYAFNKFGDESTDTLGVIAGTVAWVGAVIWDLVLVVAGAAAAIVAIVIDIVVFLESLIVALLGLIIEGIVWILTTVINIVAGILKVVVSAASFIYEVFSTAALGVVGTFELLSKGVLHALSYLASAIDSVFGTNLAAGVQNYIDLIDEAGFAVRGGILHSMEDLFDYNIDLWANQWIGYDTDVLDETKGVIDELTEAYQDPSEWFNAVAEPFWVDPEENYKKGYDLGAKWSQDIEDFDWESVINQDFDMSQFTGALEDADLNIGGGDLDSVGKINSDVNISDENLQLLRDVAAREFLLNLHQVEPKVSITFGDVRETADVNEVADVLADMMEDALATSLLYES